MNTSRRARPQDYVAGAVLHTNLTLIEVADPLLLEELLAVVKPGGGEWIMRALLKAGHTPKVIHS